MLAATNTRELLDAEIIQHTINVYNKIKYLKIRAQWVGNQVDLIISHHHGVPDVHEHGIVLFTASLMTVNTEMISMVQQTLSSRIS